MKGAKKFKFDSGVREWGYIMWDTLYVKICLMLFLCGQKKFEKPKWPCKIKAIWALPDHYFPGTP